MDGKSPKLLMFPFSAFVLYSTTIFMNPSLCSAIAYSRLLFVTVGHTVNPTAGDCYPELGFSLLVTQGPRDLSLEATSM